METKERTHSVKLTDEEMLLLDGRASQEVQSVIDQIKNARLYTGDSHLGAIISRAIEIRKLTVHRRNLTRCQKCGRSPGHAHYKRGPNRGRPNYDKPLVFYGYTFCDGFVTMQHHSSLGFCEDCGKPLAEEAQRIIIENDLQVECDGSRWVVEDLRSCYSCNAEFGEFDMSPDYCIMGDGLYPAGCPECGVRSNFARTHRTVGKRVVPREGLVKRKNLWIRASGAESDGGV